MTNADMVQALDVARDLARSNAFTNYAADPAFKLDSNLIVIGRGYEWKWENPPVYWQMRETIQGLQGLNELMREYASLLLRLSGDEVIGRDQIESFATELNSKSKSIALRMGSNVQPEGFALLSTSAAEAFSVFLESKRKADLRSALKQNHENIKRFSESCIALIHALRGIAKTQYNGAFSVFERRLARMENGFSAYQRRREAIESALLLNERFVDNIEILRSLEDSYLSISQVHADLEAALDGDKTFKAKTRRLISFGKRAKHLHEDLLKD